jgi:hypothetical protein
MLKELWELRVRPHVSTIVIYVVIIMIVYWCITSERKDQNCADLANKICGPGKGRAYYNSHPEAVDDYDTLVRKLQATAKYDQLSVHWRMNMLVAIISAFLVVYIVEKKFPSARTLGIAIIVIYLVGYAAMIQFQHAVAVPAGKQADAIATQLLYRT